MRSVLVDEGAFARAPRGAVGSAGGKVRVHGALPLRQQQTLERVERVHQHHHQRQTTVRYTHSEKHTHRTLLLRAKITALNVALSVCLSDRMLALILVTSIAIMAFLVVGLGIAPRGKRSVTSWSSSLWSQYRHTVDVNHTGGSVDLRHRVTWERGSRDSIECSVQSQRVTNTQSSCRHFLLV